MQVRCTQCGADVEVRADQRLLECPFCSSALVVDAEGTLFDEVMLATVEPGEAPAHLRRFMAGRDTVADLDKQAVIGEPQLEYFPFWAFTVGEAGAERAVLHPAAPSSLQGLHGMTLPAGTTQPMSREAVGGAVVRDPEVPAATAREWLKTSVGDAPVRRTVLYHLPLYRLSYQWRGRTYQAAVDGVSGKVFPADFPAKSEAPYALVAVLAVVVFGLEGLVISNLLLKVGVYLVSAVPILGIAWLTSRRI